MLFHYETSRLILQIVSPDAAAQVLDFYLRDRELFEYFEPDRIQNFYTIKYQKEVLRYEYNLACKLSHIRFYVYQKTQPDFIIGTICFHNITSNPYFSCEVGYKFSSAFHHHGYAAEALEKGIDILFTEVHVHRIVAWVMLNNEPSIHLLTSLGFQQEGVSRHHLYMHGQWFDHAQYSLISPL